MKGTYHILTLLIAGKIVTGRQFVLFIVCLFGSLHLKDGNTSSCFHVLGISPRCYLVDQRPDWKAETRVALFQGAGRNLITSGSFLNINGF